MVGIYTSSFAQSAIKIEANSTVIFAVNIDNKGYLTAEAGNILVTQLKEGSHIVDIAINDSIVINKNVFTADKTLHTFKLKMFGDSWRLSIYAEEPLEINTQTTPDEELVIAIDTATLIAPTQIDSNQVFGCKNLTHPNRFNNFKQQLTNTIFESKRIQLLNDSLPHFCIATHQFSELLKQIDFEDNKLALIKTHFTQVFDIEQYNLLKEELILQQSIEKFNAFLQSDQYNQHIKNNQ